MIMQTISTDHRSAAARTTPKGSPIQWVAGIAAIISAAAVVALLIAWIVAASLGLGADGRPGVGPDRPPAPDLYRVTAGAPTLARGALI